MEELDPLILGASIADINVIPKGWFFDIDLVLITKLVDKLQYFLVASISSIRLK